MRIAGSLAAAVALTLAACGGDGAPEEPATNNGGRGSDAAADTSVDGAGGAGGATVDAPADRTSDAVRDVSAEAVEDGSIDVVDVSADIVVDAPADVSIDAVTDAVAPDADAGATDVAAPDAGDASTGDAAADGPAGRCTGTATTCASLTTQQCATQRGCGIPGTCADFDMCASFASDAGPANCPAANGCTWNGTDCVHGGDAGPACASFATSFDCAPLRCGWVSACQGAPSCPPIGPACGPFCTPIDMGGGLWLCLPISCASLNGGPACTAAGCQWITCGGAVAPCSTLDRTACTSQIGCTWQ